MVNVQSAICSLNCCLDQFLRNALVTASTEFDVGNSHAANAIAVNVSVCVVQ